MLVATAFIVSCGADDAANPTTEDSLEPDTTTTLAGPELTSRVLVEDAAFPVAPIAEADGGVLYAERLTGAVRSIGVDGVLAPDPVATVEVVGTEDDQRGLLGLLRLDDGRLVGSWTRAADGRLVVGEVAGAQGGAGRLIWVGPESADRANGGTLAEAADGRILIGIGDLLEDRELDQDPTVPNRKVLALDPDGSSDQQPQVLSSGWNNPFALAVDPDGIPWVADNTGGAPPERIGRADRPAEEATGLGSGPDQLAPAALVALPDGELGLCGWLSGTLERFSIVEGAPVRDLVALATPCSTGATVLADGRLVTTTVGAVHLTTGPV